MENNKEIYQSLYDDFMTSYKMGAVSAEQVGEIIARLAGYFCNYNLAAVQAEKAFAAIAKENVLQNNEQTGKPISSAKAETISAATNEAHQLKLAKAHVLNTETLIAGLKFLQKGLIQEYGQSNLS